MREERWHLAAGEYTGEVKQGNSAAIWGGERAQPVSTERCDSFQ